MLTEEMKKVIEASVLKSLQDVFAKAFEGIVKNIQDGIQKPVVEQRKTFGITTRNAGHVTVMKPIYDQLWDRTGETYLVVHEFPDGRIHSGKVEQGFFTGDGGPDNIQSYAEYARMKIFFE